MSAEPKFESRRVLQGYYAATFVFLLPDYGAGLNLRIAGLDGFPQLKAAYFLVIFGCFGLTLWRRALSTALTNSPKLPPNSSNVGKIPRIIRLSRVLSHQGLT